ncbi:unnamed protein product [Sphagnum balticum]
MAEFCYSSSPAQLLQSLVTLGDDDESTISSLVRYNLWKRYLLLLLSLRRSEARRGQTRRRQGRRRRAVAAAAKRTNSRRTCNTERAGNKRRCATIEYTQRDSPGVAIEATPFPTAVYTFHHSPSATLP